MKHIPEQDREQLKASLQAEQRELETQLESLGRRNPSNPADWEAEAPTDQVQPGDYNEQADKIEAYEENAAILKELEIRWGNVKDALGRMEQGSYGLCEVNGHPIELERLHANPAARTCMEHKDINVT